MSDEWIVVPGWERFQHYRDRSPAWIKNYVDLLQREEYLGLGAGARALLHGIWLAFAHHNGTLRASRVHALTNLPARRAHLDSLQAAGFIELSASKPLPLALEPLARARAIAGGETEREKEPPLSPPQGGQGQILGQALPDEPPPPSVLARAEPKPERKRNGSRNGDAPPAPKTSANVMADVLRWLQSPAFDAETMDEEAVLEELGVRERRLQATVTQQQRDELLAVARQKREGYSEHWTGREP
jgi:alkylhydroperoxidase family enzyme